MMPSPFFCFSYYISWLPLIFGICLFGSLY
uniref:Uncharacterized protein n=1 Tax=Rhizophora mucronata TaxID=61149 RepID=A0A2P2PUL2_RHIMU